MPALPRGTVTFLFSDIEHSTRLLQRLGDRYADVLAEYRRLLRETFQAWDGHEIDTAGDGFFVAFQGATQAVAAAVVTQRALAGAFIPEVAMQIAAGRDRRNTEELRQRREREERHARQTTASDPRERAVAEAKRVECLARIRAMLAPTRSRPGLRT